MITDEELKLGRLKTIEIDGHRTNIKNKNRDNKILEMQKYFAAGRLVNIHIYCITLFFIKKDILMLLHSLIQILILQFFICLHFLYYILFIILVYIKFTSLLLVYINSS